VAQVPFDTKSYVCIHVFDRTRPVLYVTREDGDWCALCGDSHPDDASAYRVVHLGHVLEQDPTLTELLDLSPNEEAERDEVGGPWVRTIVRVNSSDERAVDFHLANAEARHREAPESFPIPSRAERENVGPGSVVKLLFELTDPIEDDPSAERMWVEVRTANDQLMVGQLVNEPGTITTIDYGDEVRFGPEHIIEIYIP
jgi:uncharacterized protein YegJ (DUF2314 family)